VVSVTTLPLYTRERAPIPIGYEVVWAPEPVWTPWQSGKIPSLPLPGFDNGMVSKFWNSVLTISARKVYGTHIPVL